MSQTRTRMADDPAQAGLFDLDDPDIVGNTAERRLAARVAARVPKDAVLRPVDGGDPTVLIAVVAQGTYGQVTGLDPDRKPTTAQGYVVHARTLRGGIGGWHPDAVMVVKLADLPDGPAVATVQTDMDGRLTVLAPPGDMPPGESAPWLRMPVEVQILAARTVLGLRVRVFDGPHNELWDVDGCTEQLAGPVAWWLFGGDYGSWEARARPVFSSRRVDDAVRAGRMQAHGDPLALSASSHQPANPRDAAADTTAAPARGRRGESRPGIGRQRRQVTAWLAEGLIYQSIADAARQPGTDEFRTPEGGTVGMDRIDAHLAEAVGQVLRGDGPHPGVGWRGVTITFQPVDEQTVQMRLTTDGINHVRIPVPTSWISDDNRGRIRGAIGDSIATAHTRAKDLIAAAESLADRIHTPPQGHAAELPSIATAESVADYAPASSCARVAFPRPPHAPSGPASPPRPTSAVQTPQPSATQGNRR
jgi:hypothetical protein